MQDEIIKEIKVVENGSMAELYTPYNPDFVSNIKTIYGRKWDTQKKCWSIPVEGLPEARDYMKTCYGFDDISQPVTYKYWEFTPMGPSRDLGIPVKDQIFEREGKACKCTSVKYNRDLDITYIHYTDITDTDEGKKFIDRQRLEYEKNIALKELKKAAKILGAETHNSHDEHSDVHNFSDDDILWSESTISSRYIIFANDRVAGVLHVVDWEDYGSSYTYTFKPRQEAEEFVETIKNYVKKLRE